MAMSLTLDAEIASKSPSTASTDTETLQISNQTGYRSFRAGGFHFTRDEYFARLSWPGGTHIIPIDVFLRAMMRDVAWGFFYGVVNFDGVFGTINHYGEVTMFAGRFNDAYRNAGRDYEERFQSEALMGKFKELLSDWTIEGYDPFAAPMETGAPWGVKKGGNDDAVGRERVTARRMVGLPGDTPVRTDEIGFPVNRQFADVAQDQPLVEAEPGFEHEVSAYNLFGYLSRSDVTWNPCPPFSFGPGAAVHNRIGPFPGPKGDKVTVDFNVTAIYGEDVQFLKTLGIDGNTRFDRNDGLKFGLTQAYAEFYLPVLEGTSVMVGSFQTPLENEIGYAFTPPNWFATHTYAFQHGPAKHVGVLVESRVVNSPTFGLLGVEAGIVKGWNNWTNENGDPSFIGALRWRSADMNTWIDLEGIYGNGNEDFGPGPGRGGSPYFALSSTGKYLGRLSTYLVVTQTLSKKLSVAFEGTYGQQMPGDVKFVPFAITEKAKWYGANVSARYALAPTVFLNARGEWFNDEKGAHALWNTARGDVFAATANVEWQLSPAVRVRGEVRYDDHTGAGRLFDNNTKNQQAVGLANIFFLF